MSTFLTLLQAHPTDANDWFYDIFIWVLAVVPLAIVILLAAANRQRKPELPHATDMTWNLDVVENDVPVIIHAYHKWSIGDRVIEAQVEQLSDLLPGRAQVLWLDIEANPGVVGAYPTLGQKCVALFVRNRLVWQAQGVHDAQSMLREIEPLLATDRPA